MYLIKNRRGQVIAFSGRLLSTANTDLPKYLNSRKHQSLTNGGHSLIWMWRARRPAKTESCTCLKDSWTLFQLLVLGFRRRGLDGNQLTEEWDDPPDETTQPDICYDGDSAGKRD